MTLLGPWAHPARVQTQPGLTLGKHPLLLSHLRDLSLSSSLLAQIFSLSRQFTAAIAARLPPANIDRRSSPKWPSSTLPLPPAISRPKFFCLIRMGRKSPRSRKLGKFALAGFPNSGIGRGSVVCRPYLSLRRCFFRPGAAARPCHRAAVPLLPSSLAAAPSARTCCPLFPVSLRRCSTRQPPPSAAASLVAGSAPPSSVSFSGLSSTPAAMLPPVSSSPFPHIPF